MGVLWNKVWFDLWHNKLRTVLVVVSITVGVFAVGTTFGMVEMMLPAMDAAHQATFPSHATLYMAQPVAADTLLALADTPGVEAVEPLNTVEIRYKLNLQESWRKGSILMRADYEHQSYDVVQLKAGHWPEGRELSIERMHAPFYGIEIGDQVILEVNNQEHTYPITGKIRHPFVPPPSMYDWAWFFGGEEIIEQFGIPRGYYSELKLRVTDYTPENARLVASAVKERLSKQGILVQSTMYQDPNKHWGRVFIDGISLVIEVLAALSMLLSVVLVLNTLTAIITQQTNQIGILKAVGVTSGTVTQVYMAGVLAYGLLSLGIALPAGTAASYQVTRVFLGLYNIDFTEWSLSPKLIFLQVFAAILVPLAAALVPVLQGAAITVRQAISSYGLGGDFSSTPFDRFIERIVGRRLISYQAIALTNTFRRKGRLVLTQVVLVMAGVMFLMVQGLSSSIGATTDHEFARRTYDVIVNFEELQRVDRTTALAESLPGVDNAAMWLVVPATILRGGQKTLDAGLGSQLQGVPLDDPFYIPLIVEGRWLQAGDERAVVMNKETADKEHFHVGDRVTLDLGSMGKHEWQLVGLYRVYLFFSSGFSVDAIYAPREAVYAATKKNGKGGTLLVRTTDHSLDATTRVAGDLGVLFQERNIAVYSTETTPNLKRTSDNSFAIVVMMLLVLALIVALVGGIGLTGALSISVIERTKEIGVMRAIGARSPTILGMFVMEGVLQGVLSWVIAAPISMLVTPFMANALGQTLFQSGLEYQYNFGAMFAWLALVLVIAALASLIPAGNAARVNVRQSLTYE